ncbi:MAG: hypothetical protein GVY16_05040 [Planctomycetes bacterium]|jgi:predicted N-acetyltransferase YhbS|nr:hypothetical protein [Planctomycetota bacterium]
MRGTDARLMDQRLTLDVHIRDTTSSDIDDISSVTEAVFRSMDLTRHTEPLVLLALRKAGGSARH